jgi:hypothetical protein
VQAILVGMKRALLFSVCVWSLPALAQPADCVPISNGPELPMQVWVGIDGKPGVPDNTRGAVWLDLGAVPANGTICAPEVELPDDVLRGAPAPHGLLQGNGPRDVLRNVPESHVTVKTAPGAPRP